MKATYAPMLAALLVLGMGAALVPGSAQLPPTNMGKYVHQPGDNQYSDATQATRHGAPPQMQVRPAAAPAAMGGWTPAPAAPKPDPTVEPIAADEPVPPAGFPPLPDRLDLPVANSGAWNRSAGGGGGGGGGYSGGGGGYDGPAPGMSGGGGGAPTPTFHQHYGHVAPGAYQQQKSQGYYRATSPPTQASGGGGTGYYKARSPNAPIQGGTDYYNTNTAGGAPGAPQYTGASERDLKALGREPKLSERQGEQMQTPDAPTPVVVSQSTTQDLSLPEDEFSYRHGGGRKSQLGKSMTRMIKAPLNSVGGVAGVRF